MVKRPRGEMPLCRDRGDISVIVDCIAAQHFREKNVLVGNT